jgi:ketosteroid isomerase-like protein
VDDHFHRFNSMIKAWGRKDIDGVLALMTDDIVWHFAAAIAPPVVGKAKVRKFLDGFAPQIAELRWRIFHHAESGDRLFFEGVDEYIGTDGKRIATPYASVVEFRDGLICGWRDYFDGGLLEKLKAGEPLPPYVEALIARPSESA